MVSRLMRFELYDDQLAADMSQEFEVPRNSILVSVFGIVLERAHSVDVRMGVFENAVSNVFNSTVGTKDCLWAGRFFMENFHSTGNQESFVEHMCEKWWVGRIPIRTETISLVLEMKSGVGSGVKLIAVVEYPEKMIRSLNDLERIHK